LFDSVVVITDRVVLDRQLQNTIYQFDHRQGVVQKIDEIRASSPRRWKVRRADHHHHPAEIPFVSGQLPRWPRSAGRRQAICRRASTR
jgi:type I restriction enzyme, R subunit